MNIEYLHYFLDVARTKSITQAARLNFISPQGMSRAMNELEKELDCQLLVRYSNKLSLSPLGEELVPRITEITDRYRDMLEFAASSSMEGGSDDNTLMLLCHNIAMLAFLPSTAIDFLFASKELPFQEANNSVIRQLMTPSDENAAPTGKYIALMGFFDNGRNSNEDGIQALEAAGLQYRPYLKTYDMAIVSKNSPLAEKAALTDSEMTTRPLITTNSYLHSVLAHRYGQDSITAATGDFSLRRRMVCSDMAHSFLPAIYALRNKEDDFVLVPLEKTYEVEIGFMGTEDSFKNEAFKKFLSLIDDFYENPENLASELYTLYK